MHRRTDATGAQTHSDEPLLCGTTKGAGPLSAVPVGARVTGNDNPVWPAVPQQYAPKWGYFRTARSPAPDRVRGFVTAGYVEYSLTISSGMVNPWVRW
jgi:hypothetical protein